MAKRKTATKPKAKAKTSTRAPKPREIKDPEEFSEHVEGLEQFSEPIAIQDYLDEWQMRLAATDDPKKATLKKRALRYIEVIEADGNPLTVFNATIHLGQCFARMGFLSLIAKAVAGERRGNSLGGKNSAEFIDENSIRLLLTSYDRNKNRKNCYGYIAKDLAGHKIFSKKKKDSAGVKNCPVDAKTIRRALKRLGKLDNATVV